MQSKVSEVQITPIKPVDGLIGFASFVFDRSFYLGGVGIYTRPSGGYRLAYPTRKSPAGSINVFHPINRCVAESLELAVTAKFEELMSK